MLVDWFYLTEMKYLLPLPEMVTQCSVPSWCRTWRTCPVRSVWWCVVSGGSCWNRMRRTPTRDAVNRWVQHHLIIKQQKKLVLHVFMCYCFSEEEGVRNWNEQIYQCKSCFPLLISLFVGLSCCCSCIFVSVPSYFSLLYESFRVCQRRSSSGSCLSRRSVLRGAVEPVVLRPRRRTPRQR